MFHVNSWVATVWQHFVYIYNVLLVSRVMNLDVCFVVFFLRLLIYVFQIYNNYGHKISEIEVILHELCSYFACGYLVWYLGTYYGIRYSTATF